MLGSPVVEAVGQQAGMSPGCAARVRVRSGRRAFVKAVGAELNADSVALFRHEADVLTRLPRAPRRPALIAAYDEQGWAALVLEDVDGRHPNLANPVEAELVWHTVERQCRELTPPPDGLQPGTVGDTLTRWLRRWTAVVEEPPPYVPDGIVRRFDPLSGRVATLPERVGESTLCHFDIRDDNLLIRPDGGVVVVDWGMTRLGPAWTDLFGSALEWVDTVEFDRRMGAAAERFDASEDTVTDLLLLFAGAQSWRGEQDPPPGLPTLPAFCRREAVRMWSGHERHQPVGGAADR
ncbi:MAG: aminoglycoside phosphotransferase family protein [Actinomycetota bacterium]|nr:aminoglycoside phosphotransferase family protein [Actinomycetota bacterium]